MLRLFSVSVRGFIHPSFLRKALIRSMMILHFDSIMFLKQRMNYTSRGASTIFWTRTHLAGYEVGGRDGRFATMDRAALEDYL